MSRLYSIEANMNNWVNKSYDSTPPNTMIGIQAPSLGVFGFSLTPLYGVWLNISNSTETCDPWIQPTFVTIPLSGTTALATPDSNTTLPTLTVVIPPSKLQSTETGGVIIRLQPAYENEGRNIKYSINCTTWGSRRKKRGAWDIWATKKLRQWEEDVKPDLLAIDSLSKKIIVTMKAETAKLLHWVNTAVNISNTNADKTQEWSKNISMYLNNLNCISLYSSSSFRKKLLQKIEEDERGISGRAPLVKIPNTAQISHEITSHRIKIGWEAMVYQQVGYKETSEVWGRGMVTTPERWCNSSEKFRMCKPALFNGQKVVSTLTGKINWLPNKCKEYIGSNQTHLIVCHCSDSIWQLLSKKIMHNKCYVVPVKMNVTVPFCNVNGLWNLTQMGYNCTGKGNKTIEQNTVLWIRFLTGEVKAITKQTFQDAQVILRVEHFTIQKLDLQKIEVINLDVEKRNWNILLKNGKFLELAIKNQTVRNVDESPITIVDILNDLDGTINKGIESAIGWGASVWNFLSMLISGKWFWIVCAIIILIIVIRILYMCGIFSQKQTIKYMKIKQIENEQIADAQAQREIELL